MLELFREVVHGLKKNPVPTFCGILGAVVVYLWMELAAQEVRREKTEAFYRAEMITCINEKIAMERRCAATIDSIRREEMRKTENQIREMEGIIKKYKRR